MLEILEGDTFPVGEYDLFLDHDIASFFNELLSEKGMTKSEMILHSNIDSGYAYQILDGTSIARRDYYLRIAIAVKLDEKTTQRMLAVTGVGGLHPLNKRDAAVIFALKHGYDNIQTYELMTHEKLLPLEQDAEPAKKRCYLGPDSNTRLSTTAMKVILGGPTFPSDELKAFLDPEIAKYFKELLSKTAMKKREIIQKAGLKESYGYAIFQGARLASAEYYIKIAIAMALDLRTTQRLLSVAGAGCLHPLNYREAAIIFCINKKYDNEQTNKFLRGLKLPNLGD